MKYFAHRRVNGVRVTGEGRTQHQADLQADINAKAESQRQKEERLVEVAKLMTEQGEPLR